MHSLVQAALRLSSKPSVSSSAFLLSQERKWASWGPPRRSLSSHPWFSIVSLLLAAFHSSGHYRELMMLGPTVLWALGTVSGTSQRHQAWHFLPQQPPGTTSESSAVGLPPCARDYSRALGAHGWDPHYWWGPVIPSCSPVVPAGLSGCSSSELRSLGSSHWGGPVAGDCRERSREEAGLWMRSCPTTVEIHRHSCQAWGELLAGDPSWAEMARPGDLGLAQGSSWNLWPWLKHCPQTTLHKPNLSWKGSGGHRHTPTHIYGELRGFECAGAAPRVCKEPGRFSQQGSVPGLIALK